MREPNSRLAQARERKEAYLPEIARLSLQGHTSREVAEKVGIPKTTVLRWRNSLRRECASRSVKETLEMIDKLNVRYDTIYKLLAERLDRVAAGLCPRLMIFLPPQHGKSELVSRRFPAFVLGRNPELRLIGSSHTNDLATSMNRDVQRIICDNAYRKLFPDCRLSDRWVRTASRVEARRTLNLFKDKLLYVDAILDHIVLDQLVRKTLLFCEQKKPDFVGIEAEQFQEMKDEG